MKGYSCASAGYECTWKHTARTEDLLADIVALHMREVHGLSSLDAAGVARIKRSFSGPGTSEMESEEPVPALREFRCSDLGQRCSWHYIAQTEDLIVDGVALHAREVHGITEFTQEMKAKVEKSLRLWNG